MKPDLLHEPGRPGPDIAAGAGAEDTEQQWRLSDMGHSPGRCAPRGDATRSSHGVYTVGDDDEALDVFFRPVHRSPPVVESIDADLAELCRLRIEVLVPDGTKEIIPTNRKASWKPGEPGTWERICSSTGAPASVGPSLSGQPCSRQRRRRRRSVGVT